MRWTLYLGCAILVAWILLSYGAPLAPVALGCVAAGVFNFYKRRSARHAAGIREHGRTQS